MLVILNVAKNCVLDDFGDCMKASTVFRASAFVVVVPVILMT